MATHSSILAWKTTDGGTWLGYSPWGRKELDTTEQLDLTSYTKINSKCKD